MIKAIQSLTPHVDTPCKTFLKKSLNILLIIAVTIEYNHSILYL